MIIIMLIDDDTEYLYNTLQLSIFSLREITVAYMFSQKSFEISREGAMTSTT